MDRGAWQVAVHGVSKSQTRLSDFTFTFHFHALEKEMATHSSVLAWRIPGTGEPVGLLSMGSHRVGHDWSDSDAAAVFLKNMYSSHLASETVVLGYIEGNGICNQHLKCFLYKIHWGQMFHTCMHACMYVNTVFIQHTNVPYIPSIWGLLLWFAFTAIFLTNTLEM